MDAKKSSCDILPHGAVPNCFNPTLNSEQEIIKVCASYNSEGKCPLGYMNCVESEFKNDDLYEQYIYSEKKQFNNVLVIPARNATPCNRLVALEKHSTTRCEDSSVYNLSLNNVSHAIPYVGNGENSLIFKEVIYKRKGEFILCVIQTAEKQKKTQMEIPSQFIKLVLPKLSKLTMNVKIFRLQT